MDPTKIHSLRIHCFQSQHNAGYLEGRDEYNTLFLFITHLSKQMITELHENARGLRVPGAGLRWHLLEGLLEEMTHGQILKDYLNE